MKRLLMMMFMVLAAGCTNEPAAERALRGAGYSEVEFTGYSLFGCSDSDDFAVGFKAKGPTGQSVAGVVCSGLLKGATIRTN